MPALLNGLALAKTLSPPFSLVSPLANSLSIDRVSISRSPCRLLFQPLLVTSRTKFSALSMMEACESVVTRGSKHNPDKHFDEDYRDQAKLLQEFCNMSTVDKAWIFNSCNGTGSWAMFYLSQTNLLANKRTKYILSSYISKEESHSLTFQCTPFPFELVDVSTVVPSPSGSKLLIVRNGQNGSAVQLEIWSSCHMQKDIHIPVSVHGPLYTDGWFEGISWSDDEQFIAYVAEAPSSLKPMFNSFGIKEGPSDEKNINSWKGQGDWEEQWGESYSGKGKPSLFVVNVDSGEAQAVEGIPESLSVGQVVWAPLSPDDGQQTLVFVGWSDINVPHRVARKLGIKYCYNRPCSLYAVRAPVFEPKEPHSKSFILQRDEGHESASAINLTGDTQSAYFPCFTPDGRFLLFVSAKSAVESGAHCATNSLHRMNWSSTRKPDLANIIDLVPVVMHADVGSFPGLYCDSIIAKPWLSDGSTLILSSVWGSTEVLISVDVLSGKLSRISPHNSDSSWNLLAVDGGIVLAVSSNPVSPPQIKYGCFLDRKENETSSEWDWQDISLPKLAYSEKVKSMLSLLQFNILKIDVPDLSGNLTTGAKQPFEAIFIHSNSQGSSNKGEKENGLSPLIVVIHGGPHSVSLASYSKSLAFLASLGFSLLVVNYRGSLGFGEEALQSLPGKIGSQDVKDVLTAIDHVVNKGYADPSKIFVLGGSHGGFLTSHLIGQEPDKFVAAAVRNPVCNIASMVGTTDIPDWCYFEAYGSEGKNLFTEAPSVEHLEVFYKKSPISYVSKVKSPVLFLLGAQDLRVPVSNGLQFARALREKGVKVKIVMFPNDIHPIERPQSDFESFLNIGVWFKNYCS
ncbi:acylamino-acid-releasing enzyme isoform X1 [Nymphaea colorata]|nr:acylamino-acid-releasing enzyme isoform X1 [Nymphaea colorata]